MRKTSNLLIEKPVELDEHHEEADILFIGFISSKGAIQEGAERLNAQGIKSKYNADSTTTSYAERCHSSSYR